MSRDLCVRVCRVRKCACLHVINTHPGQWLPKPLLNVFYCYYTFKVVSGTKNICMPRDVKWETPNVIKRRGWKKDAQDFNIKARTSFRRKDVFITRVYVMRLQREAASKNCIHSILKFGCGASGVCNRRHQRTKACVLETWIPYENYPLHCLANYFPTAKLCVRARV